MKSFSIPILHLDNLEANEGETSNEKYVNYDEGKKLRMIERK